MNPSNDPFESPDTVTHVLSEPSPTASVMIPVEALVSPIPAEPSSLTDGAEEIRQILARLEIKLDRLLSKPPIVAHIDPSDILDYVVDQMSKGIPPNEIRFEIEKGEPFGSP